jgi:hypothetical protein
MRRAPPASASTFSALCFRNVIRIPRNRACCPTKAEQSWDAEAQLTRAGLAPVRLHGRPSLRDDLPQPARWRKAKSNKDNRTAKRMEGSPPALGCRETRIRLGSTKTGPDSSTTVQVPPKLSARPQNNPASAVSARHAPSSCRRKLCLALSKLKPGPRELRQGPPKLRSDAPKARPGPSEVRGTENEFSLTLAL